MRANFVDDPARQCGSKLRYPSKAAAKKAIRVMQTRRGNTTQRNAPYLCPHCNFWHYGGQPGTRRRPR